MRNQIHQRIIGLAVTAIILSCLVSLLPAGRALGFGEPPTIGDIGDQSVNEDIATSEIPFIIGDIDDPIGSLSVSATSSNQALVPDANISLSGIDANRTIKITPSPDENGFTIISVVVDDGTSTTSDTFVLSVAPINDEPFFMMGSNVTVYEDFGVYTQAWATQISSGPPDESTQILTFSVSNDNNNLFSLNPRITPTGTLEFITAPNANGIANVAVAYLMDDGGTSNGGDDTYIPLSNSFTISITPVNDEPSFTAGNDVYVEEDSGNHNIPWASGMVAGPADESNQTLSFITSNDQNSFFITQPQINANSGHLSFRLSPDAQGTAIVTVFLQDDGSNVFPNDNEFGPVDFSIHINPINDPPSFSPGSNLTVGEDSGPYSSIWATNINPGPFELDQTLTFITTNDNNALFAVQPAISSDGLLAFTPAQDANGSTSLTVYLQDNGGTANGGIDTFGPMFFSITINPVNDPPSLTPGGDVNVPEDFGGYSSIWATDIKAGPIDESGQSLTISVSNNNNSLFNVQPVLVNDGTLTFSTTPNANGNADILVSIQDDGGIANGGDDSSIFNFQIIILPLNDFPTANNDTYDANEDNLLAVASPGVIGNDTDPDTGDILTVISFDSTSQQGASVNVSPDGGFQYDPGNLFQSLGQGDTTTDSFNYAISDGNGGFSSATVTITIYGMNDIPSLGGLTAGAVVEDTSNPLTANGSLTIFDLDVGESKFISQLITTSFSSFAISETGDWIYTANNNHLNVQSLAKDAILYDTFSAISFDSSATINVTISITGVNDLPTISGNLTTVKTEDDLSFTLNLLSGANDIDSTDILNVVNLVKIGGNDGGIIQSNNSLLVNPSFYNFLPFGQSEGIMYQYEIVDGKGGVVPQSATITINGVNDKPVVASIITATRTDNDPVFSVNLLAGASDPDLGSILHVTNLALISGDSSGVYPMGDTLSVDPGVYNNLAIGESEVIIYWYQITDGQGGIVNQTAKITINGANDTPSMTDIIDQRILEDSFTGNIPFTISDLEPGLLTITAESSNQLLVPNGNIVLGIIDNNNRTVKVIPSSNQNGSTTITVYVHDKDGGMTSDSFSVAVTPVNDEPTFLDAGNVTVSEDDGDYTYAYWATSLSPGPPDEAVQTLAWNISISNPSLFSSKPNLNEVGSLTFTTAPDRSGIATVRASLTDNGGTANGGINTSSIHIFTITINPVNDRPVAVDDNYSTIANEVKNDNVLSNDFDIDNASTDLVVSKITDPLHGKLAIDSNGVFTYTPELNFAGTDYFTYAVYDGKAQSNIATVTIAVLPKSSEFLRPWSKTDIYRWIKVRSGVSIDLECAGSERGIIVTLKTTGDGIVTNCMPESTARLFQVDEEDLPSNLPSRFKYGSGIRIEITKAAIPLTTLPGWMRISFVLPKETSNYSILFWDNDKSEWYQIPSAIQVTGQGDVYQYDAVRKVIIGVRTFKDYNRVEAVINFTGTFILVER